LVFHRDLGASWHWYRFEYASRSTIHYHGLAKLMSDPGLVDLTKIALQGFLAKDQNSNISDTDDIIVNGQQAEKAICKYVDALLSTVNSIDPELFIKPNTHPCKSYFNA